MSDEQRDDRRWIEVDRRSLETEAEPQRVWEAWALPERLRQWFPDEARGGPEPGGELVHVWSSFGGMEVVHQVIEAEPGRRLLLQGVSPMGPAFRQEITVERAGGRTRLELVHYGFADEADWDGEYEGVDSGWQMAFAALRHYLENHFGHERRILFQMRPTSHDYAAIQPLFRDEEGLAGWLTRSGALAGLSVGDPIALELPFDAPGDGRLTGRLLADSGRELSLSWREIDAVLELKIFPMGPQGLAAAVRCSAWGMTAEDAVELDGHLAAAVDRLVA